MATASQYVEHFPDRTYRSMIVPLMPEDKRAGNILSSWKQVLPPSAEILNG